MGVEHSKWIFMSLKITASELVFRWTSFVLKFCFHSLKKERDSIFVEISMVQFFEALKINLVLEITATWLALRWTNFISEIQRDCFEFSCCFFQGAENDFQGGNYCRWCSSNANRFHTSWIVTNNFWRERAVNRLIFPNKRAHFFNEIFISGDE